MEEAMSGTPRLPGRERGLTELYRDDPERADALAFNRRGVLRGAGLATMGAMVGAGIPFAAHMPRGLIPAALAQTTTATPAAAGPRVLRMDGKAELTLLQDRPLVAETPEHMLDDETTPFSRFFVRNNGQMPEPVADRAAWKFRIDGEVEAALELSVGELESRFPQISLFLQMECGGNGRGSFSPEARGNQWGNGAIGVAQWTGARLRDVLAAARLRSTAVYTAHYGADPHLSGATDRPSISRGMRLAKAMDEHTLIVTRMNGEPIPAIHGGPVRLLVPGWPGSLSHKWLTRIWIREREHDGPGMTGTNYRVAINPMVPGGTSPDSNFRIMESMPVRSVITNLAHGTRLPAGTRDIPLRGAAWAGELAVRAVDVSVDFGRSWQATELGRPRNRFDWQRWTARVRVPSDGYYEIWSRATDANGHAQPHVAGDWNPQGYGANPFHRVAVLIQA
jgi:sulfite oxidase